MDIIAVNNNILIKEDSNGNLHVHGTDRTRKGEFFRSNALDFSSSGILTRMFQDRFSGEVGPILLTRKDELPGQEGREFILLTKSYMEEDFLIREMDYKCYTFEGNGDEVNATKLLNALFVGKGAKFKPL